jgi:hypothetical protein
MPTAWLGHVERIHAILATVMNIVRKEVAHHGRQDSVFVSAFGLKGLVNLPEKYKEHRAAAYKTSLLFGLFCRYKN